MEISTNFSLPLPRFYFPDRLPRNFEVGQTVELVESVAKHAIHVLRLGRGDSLVLFDGEGGEFTARIHAVAKRQVVVELLAFHDIARESPLDITLAQALAAGDKMDFIVQKATELGVGCIQPLQTARCTTRLSGDRATKRLAHWRAIAISACEQCGRNRLPIIEPIRDFQDWLEIPLTSPRYLLSPAATHSFSTIMAVPALCLLIGPEGGFEPSEVDWATKHDIQPVRLGPRILRTETAGLAAVAALFAKAGDFV